MTRREGFYVRLFIKNIGSVSYSGPVSCFFYNLGHGWSRHRATLSDLLPQENVFGGSRSYGSFPPELIGKHTVRAALKDTREINEANNEAKIEIEIVPIPDNTPPLVWIIPPSDNEVIRENVPIFIGFSENESALRNIQLLVNDRLLKSQTFRHSYPEYDESNRFFVWNTTTVPNRKYTLKVVVKNWAGVKSSDEVAVIVRNKIRRLPENIPAENARPENIAENVSKNIPPENVAFENVLSKKVGKPSVEELKRKIGELEDKLSRMKELEEKFKNLNKRIGELKAQLAKQELLKRRVQELENKLLKVGWLENRVRELENAAREGKVGASVSVGEEGAVSIRTFSPAIEIASNVSKDKISVKVSSTVREGRTVLIDVDNSILPIMDLDDLLVLYDNEPVPMANSYSDVLNPFNDNSPEYLAVLGREGVQVLVSVLKFSTHEILITRKKVERRIPLLTTIFGTVIVAIIIIATFLYRRKRAAPFND